jgi:hypothetical protein
MSFPACGQATQFRPGKSGNPSGRPKRQRLTDLLLDALDEVDEEGRSVASRIVAKWLDLILVDGDVAALKELLVRVEGRAPIKVELPLDNHHADERLRRVMEALGLTDPRPAAGPIPS